MSPCTCKIWYVDMFLSSIRKMYLCPHHRKLYTVTVDVKLVVVGFVFEHLVLVLAERVILVAFLGSRCVPCRMFCLIICTSSVIEDFLGGLFVNLKIFRAWNVAVYFRVFFAVELLSSCMALPRHSCQMKARFHYTSSSFPFLYFESVF